MLSVPEIPEQHPNIMLSEASSGIRELKNGWKNRKEGEKKHHAETMIL
jgi:hypothetical protein